MLSIDEEAQLAFITNTLADLPPEDKVKVATAQAELEAVIAAHGDAGLLALAVVGAQQAVNSKLW